MLEASAAYGPGSSYGNVRPCSSPKLHFGKDFNILSHYSRWVYFPRRLIKFDTYCLQQSCFPLTVHAAVAWQARGEQLQCRQYGSHLICIISKLRYLEVLQLKSLAICQSQLLLVTRCENAKISHAYRWVSKNVGKDERFQAYHHYQFNKTPCP